MTAAAHMHRARSGRKRSRELTASETEPAATYPEGHFTALMRHPGSGEVVWPPGFVASADWRSTASHAANGTMLNDERRGHAKHGARPDGALKTEQPGKARRA